jgi:hypothetical protein
MALFENRRAATFMVVSTGSAEQCRLQPGMGWLSTASHPQVTSGGKLIKIASIFPPVFSPNSVPRS